MSNHIRSLDGARGVAVALVVVFHAWPDVLPGGWIGVSVFFTLSGFLITRQLVGGPGIDEPAPLGAFWIRRVRRLLPASLLTIAAAVGATIVFERDLGEATAEEGLAALLYVHNWHSMAGDGSYWDLFEADAPVLAHLWSLSIEEQIYLVWPLLVIGLGLRRALLAGAAVAAGGLALWWGSADAYYATPVRFAEVLFGAAVAFLVGRQTVKRVPTVLAVAAAGLIGTLSLTLDDDADIVARGALLAIGAASAIVVAWLVTDRDAGRMLQVGPLTWLGRRSYAIYLFHWPILALTDVSPFVVVAVTCLLAEASHRFVEGPVRCGSAVARPTLVFGAATVVLVVASVGLLVFIADEVDELEVAAAAEAALAETPRHPVPTLDDIDMGADTAPTTSRPTSTTTAAAETAEPISLIADPQIVLVGDSTAVRLGPALAGWAATLGGSLESHAVEACSPALGADAPTDWQLNAVETTPGCRPAVPAGADLVVVHDGLLVLLDHIDPATGVSESVEDDAFAALITAHYEALIADSDGPIVFLTPALASRTALPPDDLIVAERRRAAYVALLDTLADANPSVHVLDVGRAIERDPVRYVRSDGLHLDWETGAVNVVVDLIAPAFGQ